LNEADAPLVLGRGVMKILCTLSISSTPLHPCKKIVRIPGGIPGGILEWDPRWVPRWDPGFDPG